jgi:hypothetical protein
VALKVSAAENSVAPTSPNPRMMAFWRGGICGRRWSAAALTRGGEGGDTATARARANRVATCPPKPRRRWTLIEYSGPRSAARIDQAVLYHHRGPVYARST